MSKNAPTLQDLVKIKLHKGYYVNPISQKITYRRTHNGKLIKIPTGKTKIGEAKAFVEVELERLKSGSSLRQAKRKKLRVTNPPLSDLYAEMITEMTPGKSASTVVNYWQAYNRGLKDFWGDKHASDINDQTIAAFKNFWLEERPTLSSEKAQDHLFMLFRWLVRRKYLDKRPDVSKLSDLEELIKKNKKWKKPGRVYTDDEQSKLLACWPEFLKGSVNGTSEEHKEVLAARIRLAILLGLRRGLRIGEVVSLEREKVRLADGVLEVWSEKNSKWRDIPIEEDLAEALKYQFKVNDISIDHPQLETTVERRAKMADFLLDVGAIKDPRSYLKLIEDGRIESKWVFPSPENPAEHISTQVLSKVWHRARKYCGIKPRYPKDARFHDLRKTFATMTARLGWPPKAACEILDMTLEIYEKTYATDVGLEAKTKLITQSFGGGR